MTHGESTNKWQVSLFSVPQPLNPATDPTGKDWPCLAGTIGSSADRTCSLPMIAQLKNGSYGYTESDNNEDYFT
jgi:hypothetical protein